MNEPEKKPETTVAATVAAETSTTAAPATPTAQAATDTQTAPAPQDAPKPENLSVGTPGRVIQLKYPFKSGDKNLTEVVFCRRPKARDLIRDAGAASAAEQELYGIAALVGIIPEDLMEMDGADYLAVQKEWATFLIS